LWKYHDFSRWQQSTILNFQITLILTADELKRSYMYHRAKFHRNWSSGCAAIAIFFIFQDDARGHLGFLNSGNLNGWQRPEG